MSTLATLATVRRSWDADAGVYLKAVESADQQQLELTVAQAINQFVLGCKSDGIWGALNACAILMGARTLSGALTALVGTNPTNSNFVSGDYARKTGLKGNNSNKSLNTNRNNNADGQNDRHCAIYVTTATDTTNAFPVYIGANVLSGNDTVIFRQQAATANLFSRNASSSIDTITNQGTATGFIGASRAASASYTFRASGANTTVTRTSGTLANGNMTVFANVPGSNASNGRIAFYSIGSSLTLATLDTRVSDLYTAIGNAIA